MLLSLLDANSILTVAMPFISGFPSFCARGESTDKGHFALPLIGGMLPLVGGQSVTPSFQALLESARGGYTLRLKFLSRTSPSNGPRTLMPRPDNITHFSRAAHIPVRCGQHAK